MKTTSLLLSEIGMNACLPILPGTPAHPRQRCSIALSAAVFASMMLCAMLVPGTASAQGASVSFQVFYDQLSPYGQWVDYQNYGYVWIPDAGSDFVPYSSRGRWVLSEYGWTWVSDYPWGWAPFHYGRWNFDDNYGWLWVPDTEWGPSWVTWRRANGYYGWAPMRPGISINFSFGSDYGRDRWMFVRDRDFERNDIYRYRVDGREHERLLRGSRVVDRTYNDDRRHSTYVAGPAREDVQRGSGRRINPVGIQDNNKPGQEFGNGKLRIYRPEINNARDRGTKPAPSRVADLKDVKRVPEGRNTAQPQQTLPTNGGRPDRSPGTVDPRNTGNDHALPPSTTKPPLPNSRDRVPAATPSERTPLPNNPPRDGIPVPNDNNRRAQPTGVQPQPLPPNADRNPRPQPLPPNTDRNPQPRPSNVDRNPRPQVETPPVEKKRERQPAAASPSYRNSPTAKPERIAKPPDNSARQRQPAATPQNKTQRQPAQPRVTAPPAARGREQAPKATRPQSNDGSKEKKSSSSDDKNKNNE